MAYPVPVAACTYIVSPPPVGIQDQFGVDGGAAAAGAILHGEVGVSVRVVASVLSLDSGHKEEC